LTLNAGQDHILPGVITENTPQKKNNERFSIFVNGEFLIGVSESTLLNFNLTKGVEVTPLLFQRLQRAEGRHAVKSYLLKLLGRRDHSRRELLTKARRKDFPPDVIEDVLDELEQKQFINDRRFAEKFAADKSSLNKWGPIKIRSHLIQKGVGPADAARGVELAFEEAELKTTFADLVQKKRRRFLREENPRKRKKKILDYLCSKGYTSGDVFKHLDELMEMLSK
jgi:regulatory protein